MIFQFSDEAKLDMCIFWAGFIWDAAFALVFDTQV